MSPDDDWLGVQAPDTDLQLMTSPPFHGVYRIESQGEDGVPFDTLMEATSEPPMTPEAEVRGKGGCLAQPHPDKACWVLTQERGASSSSSRPARGLRRWR